MKKILIAVFAMVLLASCNQEKTAFIDNEKMIADYQKRKIWKRVTKLK